ncbi:hypothetical protein CRI77_10205 [Mycolicibacterium duvalii]|uniref:Uncharacterized protein n=1 Tax=Mycolicibacterium duvalii TaxID=39688 RepID=A0A7I7K2H6_9MYCO|nr:DUF190 domain-containing protein [Mycolicibacterium duvalii]MCV7366691.1 DUF190 domain-containing protein [Mycolicibacterium duvalii]PEG41528.1 hypothetical protein CRI77_10205 [Mycolicibacterium duvalii]BBX17691.1 hypothetical protein MDUV_25510 [Mycolicibacterium duvalii]
MTGELMTLTARFAERDRRNGRFLIEEMLAMCEQLGVATSIALRGIGGFGPTHVARSDRALTLSEDPPAVLIALDSEDVMRGLADEVAMMIRRGVVTLQRDRPRPDLPADAVVRVSLYLGRRHRVAGNPGHVAVCAALHRLGFTAAEVLLGVDGTIGGRRRRAHFIGRNADVPLRISAVGTVPQLDAARAELLAQLPAAPITVDPVVVCRSAGNALAPIPEPNESGYLKLIVRTAEDTLYDGRPIHRGLITRLMAAGHVGGATSVRGIWGYLNGEAPHGDRFLSLTRHVPVVTSIVDTAESIARSFPIVEELTGSGGLVTCEPVDAAVSRDDGRSRGRLGPAG